MLKQILSKVLQLRQDQQRMSLITIKHLPPINPQATKSHHVGSPPTSFQNPWPSYNADAITPSKLFQAKFLNRKPAFVPVPVDREGLPSIQEPDFGVGKDGFKATWIGHASFLLETTIPNPQTQSSEDAAGSEGVTVGEGEKPTRGVKILCDPVWSERTSPVQFIGPKRYSPAPCSLQSICDLGVDVVVISHDHYDHLDAATITEIHTRRRSNVLFLTGLGNAQWFHRQGVPASQVLEMDWWDGVEVAVEGIGSVKIYCTPSQHNSGRSPFDRGKTLWCSWAFVEVQTHTNPNTIPKRVYFAGDTGLRSWTAEEMSLAQRDAMPTCPAFQEIGAKLGPFDLALLPIGLCTPRTLMSNVHCNPWDSIQIHKNIRSKKSVGMHYGTVRGGISQEYEDVTKPAKWWREAAEEAGCVWGEEIAVVDIGETCVV